MGFPNKGGGGPDLGKIPTFSRFFWGDIPRTKIVISPGSQLSVISVANVTIPYDYSIREHPKCEIITADQMSQLSQVSRIAP